MLNSAPDRGQYAAPAQRLQFTCFTKLNERLPARYDLLDATEGRWSCRRAFNRRGYAVLLTVLNHLGCGLEEQFC